MNNLEDYGFRCLSCFKLDKDSIPCKECGKPLCRKCAKLSLCKNCIDKVKSQKKGKNV